MSCGLALVAALAFADVSTVPVAPVVAPAAIESSGAAANPLASEPLYAEIIDRAEALDRRIAAFRSVGLKTSPTPLALSAFAGFKADAATLAALDMKAHLDLKARDSDGDLKCILKGISEDLPKRIDQVEQAKSGAEQDQALDELAYLLGDNVGVIVAPPKPPV